MQNDYREDTDIFEATEELLRSWARERAQMRRSISRSLNVPREASISRMTDALRVFEAKQAGRKQPRKRRRIKGKLSGAHGGKKSNARHCYECGLIFAAAECPECAKRDAKEVAIALRLASTDSQHATETRPAVRADRMVMGLSSRAATVNEVLYTLEPRMREAVELHYAKDMPDRICARTMGMTREEFSSLRRAAVAAVNLVLAHRAEMAVKFARPAPRAGELRIAPRQGTCASIPTTST